ncbi:uncharacterized protein RJT20DRAFT_29009 [Scheffersomyces xylosifermentans]|uniref:uncharacterized protein n=1 Tax=Scheffersomyces xylosifermentans TaxID=1304137 RepID=UPI00315CDAA2
MLGTNIVVHQETPREESEGAEEETTYKGRKIPRSLRLQQMRESQKLLREQRKLKIKNLEDENTLLKKQVEMLKKAAGNYIPKSATADAFYPPKLLATTYSYEFVPINGARFFIGLPEETVNKFYLSEGKCFVTNILESSFECMSRNEPVEKSPRLRESLFRYTPNEDYMKLYMAHLSHYNRYKTVPIQWLDLNNSLPGGTISVFKVVEYICKYADLNSISMELLCTFMAKNMFATYWGPVLFVTDFSACISASSDPSYDEDYLSGTIDATICDL